ncbi:MAG TPA: hypothetical protein VFN67_16250 [Polyangiales bacterium]|nr:hypothetical protein [Polyangiales bacterium]
MFLLHSNLHKFAVAALQRTAAAAIGGLLLSGAGCSFDSAPETSGRTDPAMGAGWKPNEGASGSKADAATDASSARSEGAGGTAGSSTRTTRPPAANNAGAPARPNQGQSDPDDLDAGRPSQPAEPRRDAGRPTTTKPPEPQQPQQPIDASTTSSRCRPGVYTGTFTGSLQLIGVTLSPVTGTVRAMLELNETGGHLELRNGHVAGVDQDGNRLTCDISGRVNCDNLVLEDGLLEAGIFHNVGSDSDTAFMGSVEAMYSQEPHSLVGTFQVEAIDSSLFTGRGTWNVISSP